jgi:hypothetical protein
MRSEGFTLANFPNDTASTGTADIKKYYSKTLPNIIYNNDPNMNLANLTNTSNPRTTTSSSVLDNDWKKNIDFESNNLMSAKIAECQGSGVGDKFAQLSSLASSVDTTSRLRCGWLYNNANYTQGRGALGISSGPIDSTLSGTWMWDLNAAKKKYHTDICRAVTDCGDIGASLYQGRCGWCTKSGKAVPVSGNLAVYPYDSNTACPPNKLITSSGSCPRSEGFINPSQCTPLPNGSLSRDCLLQKVASVGCSDSGTLYQALNSGSDNDYLSNLRKQASWATYQQRAIIPLDDTALKTGKMTVADAINGFSRVQEHSASSANGGLQYAARDLCLDKGLMDTYDFCSEIPDSSNGPFSIDCLQKTFLKSGGQKTGRKYPSGSTIAQWNAIGTWSKTKAAIQLLKENTRSNNRVIQENAMMDFYGIELENKREPLPTPSTYIANVAFVRIQGTGKADCLNLSQLVVHDYNGVNVSRGRPVQSSQLGWGTVASTGNDGNERPRSHPQEVHGTCSGRDYWQVQLDGPTAVSSVTVYNRSDCCSYRMGSGYVIQFYNQDAQLIWTSRTLNSELVQKITVG